MDQGLPDEIMETDDVVRQWQNKNWEEREWNEQFDKDKENNSFDPFQVTEEIQESEDKQSAEETLIKVGECVYIEWADEESSDEAPGWYFGTVESVKDVYNVEIVYSDHATEVLDLMQVNWVRAKPGSKFYSATKPKAYKGRTSGRGSQKQKGKPKKGKNAITQKQQKDINDMLDEMESNYAKLLENNDESPKQGLLIEETEISDMIEQHGDKGEVVIEEVKETEPSAQVSSEDMINEMPVEEGPEAATEEVQEVEEVEEVAEDDPNKVITIPQPPDDQTMAHHREVVITPPGGQPTRYIEAGNILIPTTLAARHSNQQIILVQRGPNGELQEVQPSPTVIQEEEVPETASIIEESIEVETQIGHILEEHEYIVDEEGEGQELPDDDDDSNTEIVYPEDVEDEEDADAQKSYRREYVDENGNQVIHRGNVQLIRRVSSPSSHMNEESYLPPHTTEQVERYDGRIISSEQMMMGSQETTPQYRERDMMRSRNYGSGRGDIENYQRYDVAVDMDRMQGDDDDDDDDYSGDDETDPRMPRRRGKYVRKTPEELDQVPRPWSCEFCPRAFPNKYHLQIHLRTHTGEKPYRCTECDMAFSHSSNLCSHIRTHNGIKPYKCKHCGKEFGRSNNMKAHTRIHTGEKPFECRFCGKAFRFGNHLTIHERSHTGERPYKCTYCDRAFRNSSNLRTHERLHTDERPYRCRYCDRAFSGSGNLHAHERVHTGERPFVCDVCHKAFSQSSTLRIHQRIHTGDKRYQCSLCGRRFIQSNHLKTHLRRMHHIDDSLPSIRTMHKNSDPYGIEPLNPNNFRVVAKQEPDEDPFDREIHKPPTMLKRDLSLRPSPLVVDDDVRTKSWGSSASYLNHGDVDNQRMHN